MTRSNGREGITSTLRHLRAGSENFIIGAAFVLPRASGFLTLPIYTRLLGPEDFGRYELLTSIIALLYAVCLLGLDFAIAVRFYGHGEVERRRDTSSALAAAGVASLTATAVLIGLSGVVGPVLLESPNGALPFAIVVAAVPFNVLAGVLAMYLRLRSQGRAMFRAMVGGAIGGTASGLVLVVAASWGLVGAVAGLTVVHILTFALLAMSARDTFDPKFADRETSRQLVRLGAPLVPAGAASWIFALADRFFVAAFLGFTQLGLYAAAARLATILSLLVFGFHAAWGPVALRWAAIKDRDYLYSASLRLVAIVGGAAIASVSWLAVPLLWLLAGPDYLEAAGVVWLLAASVLFSAMFFVVQIGANLAKTGGRIARAMVVAAILNTVLNLALIPNLGYYGAGIATLATYVVAYVIMYAMSQRVTRIAIGFGRATAWAIGWTAVAGASTITPAGIRPFADILVVAAAVAIGLTTIAQSAHVFATAVPTGVAGRPGDGDGETQGILIP